MCVFLALLGAQGVFGSKSQLSLNVLSRSSLSMHKFHGTDELRLGLFYVILFFSKLSSYPTQYTGEKCAYQGISSDGDLF